VSQSLEQWRAQRTQTLAEYREARERERTSGAPVPWEFYRARKAAEDARHVAEHQRAARGYDPTWTDPQPLSPMVGIGQTMPGAMRPMSEATEAWLRQQALKAATTTRRTTHGLPAPKPNTVYAQAEQRKAQRNAAPLTHPGELRFGTPEADESRNGEIAGYELWQAQRARAVVSTFRSKLAKR
jgi:hypothetical protein